MCILSKLIVFPSTCFYSFFSNVLFGNEVCNFSEDKVSTLFDQISKIRVYSLFFYEALVEDELQFVKNIITSENSKYYLKKVNLKLESFGDAIELLDLLSECQNLESVVLRYLDTSSFEIVDTKDTIIEGKNDFYRKVGIISKLEFYHYSK